MFPWTYGLSRLEDGQCTVYALCIQDDVNTCSNSRHFFKNTEFAIPLRISILSDTDQEHREAYESYLDLDLLEGF